MINITLLNDDFNDLYVSAIDENQPAKPVFYNKRLNAHAATEALSVQEDGNGNFLITVTSTDVNDSGRTSTKDHSGSAGAQVPVDPS